MTLMKTLADLRVARRPVEQRNQPEWGARILELDGESRGDQASNPLELSDRVMSALLKLPWFVAGPEGPVASLAAFRYLYRLSPLQSLLRDRGLTWHRSSFPVSEPAENWRVMRRLQRNRRDWLPLSQLASGVLTGFRRITWWTSAEYRPEDVLPTAHKCGVPNDWIAPHSVLLRLDISDIEDQQLKVPTVVDGYLSLIFWPTRSIDSPPHGVTIDLTKGPPFGLGEPEIVLGSPAAERISLWPVLIGTTLRNERRISLDGNLLEQLCDFYARAHEDRAP